MELNDGDRKATRGGKGTYVMKERYADLINYQNR